MGRGFPGQVKDKPLHRPISPWLRREVPAAGGMSDIPPNPRATVYLTSSFLTQAVCRNDNSPTMMERPHQHMTMALPIALASLVCGTVMGDGSAGSVWLFSGSTDQVAGGTSRDSVTDWFTGLGRAACQIGTLVPMIMFVQPRSSVAILVFPRSVQVFSSVFFPTGSSLRPQLFNLPPPSASTVL